MKKTPRHNLKRGEISKRHSGVLGGSCPIEKSVRKRNFCVDLSLTSSFPHVGRGGDMGKTANLPL